MNISQMDLDAMRAKREKRTRSRKNMEKERDKARKRNTVVLSATLSSMATINGGSVLLVELTWVDDDYQCSIPAVAYRKRLIDKIRSEFQIGERVRVEGSLQNHPKFGLRLVLARVRFQP